MAYIGKCINCKKTITTVEIDNQKGYKIDEDTAICEQCYYMYFRRVRDFLYKNRKATADEIKEATNVSKKIIRLFYENGALEDALEKLDEQAREEARIHALEEIEKKNREQKLATLQGMKKIVQEYDNSSNTTLEDRPAKTSAVRFYMHDRSKKK